MFSRLLSSTLEKLSVKDIPSQTLETGLPTLPFPPPPPAGTGTGSLCSRCLTLLSHVVTRYGNGTGYTSLDLKHSNSIPDTSAAGRSDAALHAQGRGPYFATGPNSSLASCVICKKTGVLFDAARQHVSFEASLRSTPWKDWSLRWNIDAPDPKVYPQFAFPHDSVSVLMTVKHKGGYGWGIGTDFRQPLPEDPNTVRWLTLQQEDSKFSLIEATLLERV